MSASGRIAALGLIVVALSQAADARERAEAPPPVKSPQEVRVVAVVEDQRTQLPTVVLEGKRDKRYVAMVIGPAEATSIAVHLHGVTPPRPFTHDLFLTVLKRLNVTVDRVVITDIRDGIYYATVSLAGGNGSLTLDARPSDAIALALRANVPVLVEDRVFDKSESLPAGDRRPSSI